MFFPFLPPSPPMVLPTRDLLTLLPVSGWQSIQRAFDQIPDTPPISDGGAVHDGGHAE